MPIQAWRLSRSKYNVLDGQGAAKYGGRWNSPGHQVIYLSLDPALCILEIIVNLDLPIELIPKDYELVCVELSIDKMIKEKELIGKIDEPEYDYQQSRITGDNWLTTQRTLSLSVPSVVVPESRNLLVNPNHKYISHVSVRSKRPFKFDDRFFSNTN